MLENLGTNLNTGDYWKSWTNPFGIENKGINIVGIVLIDLARISVLPFSELGVVCYMAAKAKKPEDLTSIDQEVGKAVRPHFPGGYVFGEESADRAEGSPNLTPSPASSESYSPISSRATSISDERPPPKTVIINIPVEILSGRGGFINKPILYSSLRPQDSQLDLNQFNALLSLEKNDTFIFNNKEYIVTSKKAPREFDDQDASILFTNQMAYKKEPTVKDLETFRSVKITDIDGKTYIIEFSPKNP